MADRRGALPTKRLELAMFDCFEQFLDSPPAYIKLGAPFEKDRRPTSGQRMHFGYGTQVDQRCARDPKEALGVDACLEIVQRRLHPIMLSGIGHQARESAGRFEERSFVACDDKITRSIANQKPGKAEVWVFEYLLKRVIRIFGLISGDARQCFLQADTAHRL